MPLDPDYPSQRLIHQIDDADLALLVTQRSVTLACEQPDGCFSMQTDR